MSLSTRDFSAIWHPYTQACIEGEAIGIVRGDGAVLWAEDGREYIDAVSSWWVNIHGHAHPYISKKIKEQLDKLHHVMFAGFTHQPAVELAENLRRILPDPQSKIFFSDNGSTAVEVALKMVVQYWYNLNTPKNRIIALEGSYHGDTIGAMSASSPGPFRQPFESLMFSVTYLPKPQDAASLERLNDELKSKDVAAFIFEPLVQGASGMQFYPAQYLDQAISLCREQGVFTIADEVFTGFGRTGKTFASDYLINKPDIFCLSKGITGGSLPLGITTAPQKIYNAFYSNQRERMFLHGHSYTANPIACAAANASFEIFVSEESQIQRDRLSVWQAEFREKLSKIDKVIAPRNLGTILAFEVNSEQKSTYLNPIRDRLYEHFIKNGVILRPLGNTLYVLPPYCITRPQIDRVYESILTSLELV